MALAAAQLRRDPLGAAQVEQPVAQYRQVGGQRQDLGGAGLEGRRQRLGVAREEHRHDGQLLVREPRTSAPAELEAALRFGRAVEHEEVGVVGRQEVEALPGRSRRHLDGFDPSVLEEPPELRIVAQRQHRTVRRSRGEERVVGRRRMVRAPRPIAHVPASAVAAAGWPEIRKSMLPSAARRSGRSLNRARRSSRGVSAVRSVPKTPTHMSEPWRLA